MGDMLAIVGSMAVGTLLALVLLWALDRWW